jgi:hypothetical protein
MTRRRCDFIGKSINPQYPQGKNKPIYQKGKGVGVVKIQ